MKKQLHQFEYEIYDSIEELCAADMELLKRARAATHNAYAPYSRFCVAATAILDNGIILSGTNQENASYPAGICAERVLLSTAASLYPGIPINALAVSYYNENGASDRPISPCGICRQSLQEFEQRTGRPIRLLLGGQDGPIIVVSNSLLLLPFAFTADEL